MDAQQMTIAQLIQITMDDMIDELTKYSNMDYYDYVLSLNFNQLKEEYSNKTGYVYY
jgi:hypothetical protein